MTWATAYGFMPSVGVRERLTFKQAVCRGHEPLRIDRLERELWLLQLQ